MVDPGGQVHRRIITDDEAIGGAGYPVIPMDIQQSLVDLPDQLQCCPKDYAKWPAIHRLGRGNPGGIRTPRCAPRHPRDYGPNGSLEQERVCPGVDYAW